MKLSAATMTCLRDVSSRRARALCRASRAAPNPPKSHLSLVVCPVFLRSDTHGVATASAEFDVVTCLPASERETAAEAIEPSSGSLKSSNISAIMAAIRLSNVCKSTAQHARARGFGN